MHDAKLPENLHGLLIGGGYPELYAKQLSENETMKESFRRQIEAGMPYLAECGGFMYLHETMEDMKKERWQMVGVLPGHAFYTGKLGRFGYVELTAQKEQILGEAGETIRAHEFHYLTAVKTVMRFGRKSRGGSGDGIVCRRLKRMQQDFHICIIIPIRHLRQIL